VKAPKKGVFYIVIKEPNLKSSLSCKNGTLKIKEFKFYDEKELKNLLKKSPEVVIFSANKKEKKRDYHYTKNSIQIAKEMNYVPFFRSSFLPSTKEHTYALVRPDCVESFKKCFPSTSV